jgi:hypothetical protein
MNIVRNGGKNLNAEVNPTWHTVSFYPRVSRYQGQDVNTRVGSRYSFIAVRYTAAAEGCIELQFALSHTHFKVLHCSVKDDSTVGGAMEGVILGVHVTPLWLLRCLPQ